MNKKIKIWFLKRKLKKLHKQYYDIVDSYDCGIMLVEYINPYITSLKEKFNKKVLELKKLDKNCPDFEL